MNNDDTSKATQMKRTFVYNVIKSDDELQKEWFMRFVLRPGPMVTRKQFVQVQLWRKRTSYTRNSIISGNALTRHRFRQLSRIEKIAQS